MQWMAYEFSEWKHMLTANTKYFDCQNHKISYFIKPAHSPEKIMQCDVKKTTTTTTATSEIWEIIQRNLFRPDQPFIIDEVSQLNIWNPQFKMEMFIEIHEKKNIWNGLYRPNLICVFVFSSSFVHSFAKFELYHHLVINHFNFKMQNASAQYVQARKKMCVCINSKIDFHFFLFFLLFVALSRFCCQWAPWTTFSLHPEFAPTSLLESIFQANQQNWLPKNYIDREWGPWIYVITNSADCVSTIFNLLIFARVLTWKKNLSLITVSNYTIFDEIMIRRGEFY